MRTNIDIENELLDEAKSITGSKTKKETVERALRELIRSVKMTELAKLRGKIRWEGDLDEMRTYDKWGK